jgi:hypothetical protein
VESGWGKTVEKLWETRRRCGDVDGVGNPGSFPHLLPQPAMRPRVLRHRELEGQEERCPHFHTLYYYHQIFTLYWL